MSDEGSTPASDSAAQTPVPSEPAQPAVNNAETHDVKSAVDVATDANHDTLKYHLLGPSLTKAGQDSVDQQKVSAQYQSTALNCTTYKPCLDRSRKSSTTPRKDPNISTMKKSKTRTSPAKSTASSNRNADWKSLISLPTADALMTTSQNWNCLETCHRL